jgi:hypothetical protein
MKTTLYDTNFYRQREQKLDNLQYEIDEIKKRVDAIEQEIIKTKRIDRLFTFQTKIDGLNKRTIYKVDNILFIGSLMYQRFPTKKLFSWSEANEYAKELKISGYGGWRLPSIEELEQLFTKTAQRNSKGDSYFIIKDFVNSMPKDAKFWSSSEENEHYAWVADFNMGYDYWRHKNSRYHALFVRDIKV